METMDLQSLAPANEVVVGKSAGYHPSVWDDYFILRSSPQTQACNATTSLNICICPKCSSSQQEGTRDRLVECYFSILGVYFEPYYSRAGVMTMKVTVLYSFMDDIYDVYGTSEESQLLTDAIQRWDVWSADRLPEYIKDFFLIIIHTFEEFENVLTTNEKYRIFFERSQMRTLSRAYYDESKWSVQHYVPTLKERLQVSVISAGHAML
ncbi:hypothetical protein MUK42_36064 [Musa troglodytarum]|uniref:Terpene synthase metal-binding domain-containing protein n=1 Tax=Musa troglodytarum TaxID=320322 RepID=A0A9E7GJN2_9LILI|nr:hypothetical protein MUK42_36064 [Musa troglodytarum]